MELIERDLNPPDQPTHGPCDDCEEIFDYGAMTDTTASGFVMIAYPTKWNCKMEPIKLDRVFQLPNVHFQVCICAKSWAEAEHKFKADHAGVIYKNVYQVPTGKVFNYYFEVEVV